MHLPKHTKRSRPLFPTLIGCALCLFGACSRTDQFELLIISPHSPEIRAEFSQGFSSWYKQRSGQSVAVKWIDLGGTGEAIEYIRSRNSSAATAGGVDLFFGGGDFPFIKLQSEALLDDPQVPDSIRTRMPAHLGGMPVYDSLWYGAALSGFGIIYNKHILSENNLPLPQSWEDLAHRRFFGWVASGDPRYSGSIHVMYEILLQAYGWEKGWNIITRLGANVQTFTKGASTAAKDVSIGQAAAGLAIDFYAFTEIQRYGSQRLGFVLPAQATVLNADGIAVLKGAPEPELARAFLRYVLTDGQMLWILNPGVPGGPVRHALCRFPVDSTLYRLPNELKSVDQNPYTLPLSFTYNGRLAGKRWNILGDLVAAFLITPHTELKECWQDVIERGLTEQHYLPYLSIELSEQEIDLLAGQWGRPEFARRRVELMNQWTTRAQARYRALRKRTSFSAHELDSVSQLRGSGTAAAASAAPQ